MEATRRSAQQRGKTFWPIQFRTLAHGGESKHVSYQVYEYLVNNNVASLKTYVVRQHVHLNRDAKECTGVVYLKWSSPGAERTRANPTDDFARVINCSRRYRTPIIAEGLPVFTDGSNTAPLDVLLLDTRTSRVLYLALLDQGHCVQMDHY